MPTVIREDTLDQFPWAVIETTTDEAGLLVERLIRFDNGVVRAEVFEDGVRTLTIQRDESPDGSAVPWNEVVTVFDADEHVARRSTSFDNGAIREELFENGVRTLTTEVDESPDGSAVPWQSIVTEFDGFGQPARRVTQLDNGTMREETFENGAPTFAWQVDESQDGSAVPWRDIITEYDSAGRITGRTTNFDNDTVRNEDFEDGFRTFTFQYDNSTDGSAVPWQEINTQYDFDGLIAGRTTNFDNGTVRDEDFENGIRTVTGQFDNSANGDAVPWQDIFTQYDSDGRIEQRTTTFDDGTVRDENFENGELSFIGQFDNSADGSAAIWQDIITEYGADGQVESRTTNFDNETVRDENFENGERSLTWEFDNSAGGSAVPWQSILTEFDPDGQIERRATAFDNETTRVEEFENGVRTTTLQLDESFDGFAAPWQSILTEFDPDGQIERKVTAFDNETTKVEEFENGVRASTLQLDESFDGFAAPWQSILTEFDANGQIDLRVTDFDNGVQRTEQFEGGIRAEVVQVDMSADGHAAPWTEITTYYDADGDVQSRLRIMDDEDRFVFMFEGDHKVLEAEFDGDETDPWLFEVTRFDDQGAVADIVTYDSFEDAPLELIQLFEFGIGI